MKKTKIKSNFAGLSDPELDARASGIISAMTGNPHFPTTQPRIGRCEQQPPTIFRGPCAVKNRRPGKSCL